MTKYLATKKEFAAAINHSVRGLENLINAGKVHPIRVGRRVLFDAEEQISNLKNQSRSAENKTSS